MKNNDVEPRQISTMGYREYLNLLVREEELPCIAHLYNNSLIVAKSL